MRFYTFRVSVVFLVFGFGAAAEPPIVVKPEAYKTLVNPACSHCKDEAKRRALELKPEDRILAWTRGYSEGGAIPIRFFLSPYRVISDSYGVFVYDPDAGFSRGFAPSYDFRFHGWRNGVMVMKHKDGTLYSCLSGLAFDGPRKGTRLKPIPTVVSDWGWWLKAYPNAVAYQIFEKYRPLELPTKEDADSVKSRGKADPRLNPDVEILGVWSGKSARAYPMAAVERDGILKEGAGEDSLVVLWDPATKTASAYRPVATQPRKYKAPQPDATGVSILDEGIPIPAGTDLLPPRKVTLSLVPKTPGRFRDKETQSLWDVAGRCVEGELKGYTLEWVDSVQVKWFAWAAEYAETSLFSEPRPSNPEAPVPPDARVESFRLHLQP